MANKEMSKRRENPNVNAIKVTNANDREPYIFISYKSDDWELVLSKIVYKLHIQYGLRVYFDKAFDVNNDLWIKQFPENMKSPNCMAILFFYNDNYRCSYATCLELMYSQLESTNFKEVLRKDNRMHAIPVNIGKPTNITDATNTGLGVIVYPDNTLNQNSEADKELFNFAFNQLKKDKLSDCEFYNQNDLNKVQCAEIVSDLYAELGVNDNPLHENDDLDDYCRTLAIKIHNTCPGVFDEEKYDSGMNSKSSPASNKKSSTDDSTNAEIDNNSKQEDEEQDKFKPLI